jgi:formylglycine-generating enzyme required for sulfatase activity
MTNTIKYMFVLLAALGAALTFATEIEMKNVGELEELLPLTAVDGNGRAVTDLQKPEIVLLVNGLNFRGFSLISPGGTPFGDKPQAFPELADSPPNAYYEIVFPYVWEAGQAIRIQLGTSRSGVHLNAPKNIQKRKSSRIIEDLQAEILALELLRQNTWLNMDLTSLNMLPAATKTSGRRQESQKFYQIRLPDAYLKNGIDLFKITFQPDNTDIVIQQQWLTPASTVLEIDRENETYLLLMNRQKGAALVLKNIPESTSEQAEHQVKLSAEENEKAVAAGKERQKKLTALQAEVKLIPVDILPDSLPENADAGKIPRQEKSATAGDASPIIPAIGPSLPILSRQLTDSKASLLNKLETYRSKLTQPAKIHCHETALKYLKQNKVDKAMPWLVKLLDLVPKQGDFISSLLEKLRRLDRFQKEILSRSASLSSADLQKEFLNIQSRLERGLDEAGTADFFNDFHALLDKNQERADFVRETLSQLPEYLEGADKKSISKVEAPALPSPEYAILDLQKQVDVWQSLAGELADKTFIQDSWTSRVMTQLKKILGLYVSQSEANERCLSLLPESMAEATIGFVMANNRAFSKPYKRSFYEKNLLRLGIADAWLKEPSFFDVVLQAQALEKNAQGSWEVTLATDLSMIYIPRGSFSMGVPWESGGAQDESPPHEVELDAYWIAKNETTFWQYDRFCQDTGSGLPTDFGKGRKKRPVIGISYQNALDYCQWLTLKTGVRFRLPTEAEWEKAARGGDQRKYPWGNSDPNGSLSNFADSNFLKYYQQANPPANETDRQQILQWISETSDDGYTFTAPVGSYPQGASPFGAMDMAGNVWEWVSDWYDGNYFQISPRQNPQGSFSGTFRVVRGGSWDCNPWMLRSTSRSGAPPIPDKGSETIGFRTAASPLSAATATK